MAARLYVDGFNFYYRVFKNDNRTYPIPPHLKWVDFVKLGQRLAGSQSLNWVGYFTAYIKPNPRDPDQHLRQRAYLSALATLPELEIVPGSFEPREKKGVPVSAPNSPAIAFHTFEEKGSDVNLGCRLVWDAARGALDEAFVLSNDSDLVEAIRIVVGEIGKPVFVFSPDFTVSTALSRIATNARPLDIKLLKKCQLPDTIPTQGGPISRPPEWTKPTLT